MKDNSLTQGLEDALKQNPKNQQIRLLLVAEYMKKQHFDSALQHVQKILEEDRNSIPGLVALSQLKSASGSKSEAIVILERALSLAPNNAMIHYQLSQLKLEEGLEHEALVHYEQAKRLNPEINHYLLEDRFISSFSENPLPCREELDLGGDPSSLDHDADFFMQEIPFQPEPPHYSFEDVGGMEGLKREVRLKLILPLKERKLYASFQQKTGGSLFLYGPSGCGKTYFCQAVAGEQKVPFYQMHLEDILDSYTGLSEKNLTELFEQAQKDSPSILFLDQIDALAGAKNNQLINQTLLNKLLQELEQEQNRDILILGTTNQPWFLDESLLSAGRFERLFFVPPPDLKTRLQILDIFLKNRPCQKLQVLDLAKKTEWYTGAELRVLVERATEYAIEDSLQAETLRPITMEHFEQALADILPLSARSWFKMATPYAKKKPEFYRPLLAYLEIHQLD